MKLKGTNAEPHIHHADLWGLRDLKYNCLAETDVTSTHWVELQPRSPFYLFVPQDTALLAEYQGGQNIRDIMPVNSVGIVTSCDHLAVHMSPEEAKRLLSRFLSLTVDGAREEFRLGGDSSEWRVDVAQADLRETKLAERFLIKMLYRPFDVRYTYYTGSSGGFHGRPRPTVMRHMFWPNIALLTSRMTKGEEFAHAQVTRFASEKILMSPKTSNNSFHYPLYLYGDSTSGKHGQTELGIEALHWPAGKDGRRPNLNPEFIADLEKRLGLKFVSDGKGDVAAGLPRHGEAHGDVKSPLPPATTFGPEDVFNYIYAVFHSPTYRSRYAEFLKSDFPRVPLTSDVRLFRTLCGLGAELVALHLLESPILQNPIARYPVKGSNAVEKGFPKYVAPGQPEPGTGKPLKEGRVYINRGALTRPSPDGHPLPAGEGRGEGASAGQYFEGVPPEVWNFHIGGYQVCEKWLKDRRGRTLTYDDQLHYCKVVTALAETIRLMAEIDAAIPRWPIQ